MVTQQRRRSQWLVIGVASCLSGGLLLLTWVKVPVDVLTDNTLMATGQPATEPWLAFNGRDWHPSALAFWVAAALATFWSALQKGWLRRVIVGLTHVLLAAMWVSTGWFLLNPDRITGSVFARTYGVYLDTLPGYQITWCGYLFCALVVLWQVASWGIGRVTPPTVPTRTVPDAETNPTVQQLWRDLDQQDGR